MSHDNYAGKYATLKGKIKYIDKVLISHRRHNENATGEYSLKLSAIKVLKRGIIRYKDLAKVHARVYNQSLIMLENISQKEQLPQEAIKIKKAIETGGIKMVVYMLELGVKRKQWIRTAGMYITGILGSYKKYLVK